MKKYFSLIAVVILSLFLSCCNNDITVQTKEAGAKLKDGTETYYIKTVNEENGLKTALAHYTADGKMLSSFKYDYCFDTNGRVTVCRETDLMSNKYSETQYDKFKNKLSTTYFTSEGTIYDKAEYDEKERIKKRFNYINGNINSYTVYEYYNKTQLKSECEYTVSGKAVKYMIYYKDGKLSQERLFDSGGMVKSITKHKYKNEKLIYTAVYDSDFKITESWDYSKSPTVHTLYKDGEPITSKTESS